MASNHSQSYHNPASFRSITRTHWPNKKKNLSVFHLNARSLRNKNDDVETFLNSLEHTFDALAFTETWFNCQDSVVEFCGYNCLTMCRSKKKGGGVALYLRDNLEYDVIGEHSHVNSHFESLVVKCQKSIVAVVYRPPSGSFTAFLDFLQDVFEFCTSLKMPTIFVGDLNVNLLPTGRDQTRNELLDVLHTYGFENVIDVATRITGNSETLIDLCITNFPCADISAGVLTCDISDHLPIFIIAKHNNISNKKNSPCINSMYRTFNDTNTQHFVSLVSSTDWNDVLTEGNPNKSYEMFLRRLKDMYDASFPLQTHKSHRKSRKPWITNALYIRIRERNKLYDTFIKTRNIVLLDASKKIRNKLT